MKRGALLLIVCRPIGIMKPSSPVVDSHLKSFGRQLRSLRLAKGISQEELADLSGLHRTYIGSVERGERNLSLINIWRLAGALGCSPADLFADDNKT